MIEKFMNAFVPDKKKPVEKLPERKLEKSLDKNIEYMKLLFDGSADFTVKYVNTANARCAVLTMEGMVNKETLAVSVINPIVQSVYPIIYGSEFLRYLEKNVLSASEQVEIETVDKVLTLIMSGFAVLLVDKCNVGLAVGVQGFSFRSVSEPETEVVQKGSREGFVEPLRINMSLLRRRIKNPRMKFETLTIGTVSKTDICLCYLNDIVSQDILQELKKRLSCVDIDTVLASGYLVPYLQEENDHSLFSTVGSSERPDTVCGKINEGRIAILMDGTPLALIVPYLFVESFQTMEDYSNRPYFATFTRWLKYLAFVVSMLAPGIYVAVATFNPELFPVQILTRVVTSIGDTPFSITTEVLLIHFVYEIMREAGLRLPRPLGHAVSIIGGLVIGETAVNAGLIGAPTLMVVALTAISSYVIPNLYPPIAILRLLFIVAGGFFGIWGIVLLFCVVLVNVCSKKSFNVPFMSPIAPFSMFGMRDVLIRAGWRTLAKKRNLVGKQKSD